MPESRQNKTKVWTPGVCCCRKIQSLSKGGCYGLKQLLWITFRRKELCNCFPPVLSVLMFWPLCLVQLKAFQLQESFLLDNAACTDGQRCQGIPEAGRLSFPVPLPSSGFLASSSVPPSHENEFLWLFWGFFSPACGKGGYALFISALFSLHGASRTTSQHLITTVSVATLPLFCAVQ